MDFDPPPHSVVLLQKVLLKASMERGMITATSNTFNVHMTCEYYIKKDLKKCEPIV